MLLNFPAGLTEFIGPDGVKHKPDANGQVEVASGNLEPFLIQGFSPAIWIDNVEVEAPSIAASIGTAKGDIIAFSAANTPVAVSVGANGKILKADSSAAGGVAWEDESAGGIDFGLPTMDLSYSGIPLPGTAGASLNFGMPVCLKDDKRLHPAKADAGGTMAAVGVIVTTGVIAMGDPVLYLSLGIIRDDSLTWVPGSGMPGKIYVSPDTAGALTQTAPGVGQYLQELGFALDLHVLAIAVCPLQVEVGTPSIAASTGTVKGDIIAFSAANTPVAVPVGANGKILKANSSAPGGVAWEDESAGDGNVIGPESSVVGNIATWSGTDGDGLADSGVPLANLATSKLNSILADQEWDGPTRIYTSGTAITVGQHVMVYDSSGLKVKPWDHTGDIRGRGIAVAVDGSTITVLLSGRYRNDTVFASFTTPGEEIFASPGTDGEITGIKPSTTGQKLLKLGQVEESKTVFFDPSPNVGTVA